MADFTASNGVTVSVDRDGDYVFKKGKAGTSWVIQHRGPNEVALREFFAYQDTVKPHHSAKVGEVWDLDSTQGTTVRVLTVDDGGGVLFVAHDLNYYDLTDPVFTGGVKVA